MTSHFQDNGETALMQTGVRRGRATQPFMGDGGRLALLFLLSWAPSLWLGNQPASAQGRQQGPLIAASELRLKPGMETPLAISIEAGQGVPNQAIVVIRGMPPGMQLSEGRAFGPGVWVVPASNVANVKLRTPADPKMGGVLSVSLATLDGVSIAEAKILLIIAPSAAEESATATARPTGSFDAAALPPTAAPSFPQTPPSLPLASEPPPVRFPADPPAKLTSEERASLLMLFAKGEENLSLGNILVARQFFQRAAERGLAEAAIALATTYDPHELARMKAVSGVAADTKLARKWYEKARDLGSTEAALRLRQLP